MILLYGSWFPFFSIFPLFANLNNPLWVQIVTVYCAYINFAAYVAYDLFYTVYIIYFVYKLRNQEVKVETTKITILAIKACCHTIMSTVGIYLYSFNLPFGVIQQNIVLVGAIHVFLNWTNSHEMILCLCGYKSKVSPFAPDNIVSFSSKKSSHISVTVTSSKALLSSVFGQNSKDSRTVILVKPQNSEP